MQLGLCLRPKAGLVSRQVFFKVQKSREYKESIYSWLFCLPIEVYDSSNVNEYTKKILVITYIGEPLVEGRLYDEATISKAAVTI